MSAQQRFTLLRKLLKALGLSEARVEELVSRIQEWLMDEQAEKAGAVLYPYHLRDDFGNFNIHGSMVFDFGKLLANELVQTISR